MNYNLLFENIESEINSLLDIGCYIGNFSGIFTDEFNLKNTNILCIDINPAYKELIESRGFRFRAVGLSSERKNIPVYYPKNPDSLFDPRNSGVSYCRENTIFFSDCVVSSQEVFPLDEISNSETFDFIKIDVQGAEYDVIDGGKETLKKSKYVLVETSCGDYNIGSKNEEKTIELLSSLGFKEKKVLEEIYIEEVLQQRDILFERMC